MEKQTPEQPTTENQPKTSGTVGKAAGIFALVLIFVLLSLAMFNSHFN